MKSHFSIVDSSFCHLNNMKQTRKFVVLYDHVAMPCGIVAVYLQNIIGGQEFGVAALYPDSGFQLSPMGK